MLGHTLGFYHTQHLVLTCCIPSHHALPYIIISSACMTYMAITISSWDQKCKFWDPGSHSTQLIKEKVLNLITRPLCGAFTHRMVSTCWPTISFIKMILSETAPQKLSLSTPWPQILLNQLSLCHFQTSRPCT